MFPFASILKAFENIAFASINTTINCVLTYPKAFGYEIPTKLRMIQDSLLANSNSSYS